MGIVQRSRDYAIDVDWVHQTGTITHHKTGNVYTVTFSHINASEIQERIKLCASYILDTDDPVQCINLQKDRIEIFEEGSSIPTIFNIALAKTANDLKSLLSTLKEKVQSIEFISDKKEQLAVATEIFSLLTPLYEFVKSREISLEKYNSIYMVASFLINDFQYFSQSTEKTEKHTADLLKAIDTILGKISPASSKKEVTLYEVKGATKKSNAEVKALSDFIYSLKKIIYSTQVLKRNIQNQQIAEATDISTQKILSHLGNIIELGNDIESPSFEMMRKLTSDEKISELAKSLTNMVQSANVKDLKNCAIMADQTIKFATKYITDLEELKEQLYAQQLHEKTMTNQTVQAAHKTLRELKLYPNRAELLIPKLTHYATYLASAGFMKTVYKIRSTITEHLNTPSTDPRYKMDLAIETQTAKSPSSKFGAHFSNLDGGVLKGGHLHAIRRGDINCFDFKISHPAREDLQSSLEAILVDQKRFAQYLPQGFCKGFSIKEIDYTFQGQYSPKDAKAIEIEFIGVGKVIIGNAKKYGCLYNSIDVEMPAGLPHGEACKKLNQMLTLIGLGHIMRPQDAESAERLKIAKLTRFFAPATITSIDRMHAFYEMPIEDLKNWIIQLEPTMKEIFEQHLETMHEVEIIPGKKTWAAKGLTDIVKNVGCLYLMCGFSFEKDDELLDYLKKSLTLGLHSTETRFRAGNFTTGESPEEDLQSGGGDQVFTRLITQNLTKIPKGFFPLFGRAQLIIDLDAATEIDSYCSEKDSYGVKCEYHDNYDLYEERDNLMNLAKQTRTVGVDNEVMIKSSIHPRYIRGIAVNTQKDYKLVKKMLHDEGFITVIDNVEYVHGFPLEKFLRVIPFNQPFPEDLT